MLNKKIKAFTLAEMLVVLVISGIIITMTLLVLNLVQLQMKSIQTIYTKNSELNMLERVLWNDFNHYNLSYNSITNQLQGISEKDSVIYTFHEQYITRDLDTLAVVIMKKKVFLDGEEVKNSAIDAIELHTSEEIKNREIFVFKIKDAAHYMNN